MANVTQAIDFVLHQEDAGMTGVTTHTDGDNGGRTRWGIAEHWHPELSATGFFDGMSRDESLTVAEGVYAQQYAKPLSLAGFTSQAVATALLSFAVVSGVPTAVRTLQEVLGVTVDGDFGPSTLLAVRNRLERPLMASFVAAQKIHFMKVASAPGQAKFLQGWLNRVNACAALVKA